MRDGFCGGKRGAVGCLCCLAAIASLFLIDRSQAGPASNASEAPPRGEIKHRFPEVKGRSVAREQYAALPVPLVLRDKKPGADEQPLTVGFVYVGTKDDFGYNQAHAEAAAEVAKMPGVRVVEAEKVAENQDCETAMESMINQQEANLIFATVKLSPYGRAVSDEAKRAVTPVLDAMMQGKFQMFRGPLKDNKGTIVIPDGKSFDDEEGELWGMNYLVEGVVGSVGD